MRQHALLRSVVLLPALCLLTLPSAATHEDDPKIQDHKPSLAGPGYRAGDAGRGIPTAATIGGEAFPAEGVSLLSWLTTDDLGTIAGNDCWGYVSPSGREYALMGSTLGTHIVEITVASDPEIIGFIEGPTSLWRDIKVYGDRAYAVSEGGSGIQVISLTNVDAGQVSLINTVTSGGTNSTHNVAIDEVSGYLYRCGGGDNGLRIYSLANPNNPQFVGSWSDRYVHDVQVKTFTSGPYAGRQIAFACSGFNGGAQDTGVSIIDVTNKSNLQHIGQVSWPGAAYSHQAWLSEDGQTLFVDDELDEKGSQKTEHFIIDVSDLNNPVYVGEFVNDTVAIGHNLYVKGDLLYAANYRSGLRVFDVSTPLNATEVAYFDTDPGTDAATFNGMWSNYPFFDDNKVICSDIEKGLFVLWVGEPRVGFEFPGGVAPELIDPDGETLAVTLTEAEAGDYEAGTARIHFDAGSGLVSLDLVDLGGGAFEVDLPAFPCGTVVRYYLSGESTDGTTWTAPSNGSTFKATATTAQPVAFFDDFEADQGWTVGVPNDDATDGIWERGDPIATGAQPETGFGGAGLCWFTGQTPPGGLPNQGDVDGGKTTLLSPIFDLSNVVNPRITYWRWYSNYLGFNPPDDSLRIALSNDGGATYSSIDIVGPTGVGTEGGWNYKEIDVLKFMQPTDQMRVRFTAADNNSISVVEVAIDDFRIVGTACPDCNGNATSDAFDIAAGTVLDLDAEGTPDDCQALAADRGELSSGSGGTVQFTLTGGSERAGELYLLLGSLSGTEPGFDLNGNTVPLQQDVYFGYTLAQAGSPPLVGSFGTLDGSGSGACQFVLTPGYSNLVGLTAHHAWIAIDPVSLAASLASNALPLTFGL